jgi:hypothetical protein
MGIQCDCSCDCDEPFRCCMETTRKARKAHTCVECNEEIVIGERYEEMKGIDYDGNPFLERTCLPCVRIREHYCPGGWYMGGLAEQIEECIGWDYREHPPDEPDDPMFDGDVALSKPARDLGGEVWVKP